MAAAVYAASEGLCTIVIEGTAPGGQAGTSSKIENYLGIPTGISGQRLASRAQLQALKFGVRFAISRETITAEQVDGIHKLTLAGGITLCARAVVVASGAQYRKLSVENYAQYENRGIYYAATAMESLLCRENEVIVVGGGNSAGQAAVFLSGIAKHVHHIVRGPSLASSMSQYLISRIENSAHITLYPNSEIETLEGATALERVAWVDRATGERTDKPIGSVFVMIGAEPNSGWLYGTVKLDKKGFIVTGGEDGFDEHAVCDERAGNVCGGGCAVELGEAGGVGGGGRVGGDFGCASVSGGPSESISGGAELGAGGAAVGGCGGGGDFAGLGELRSRSSPFPQGLKPRRLLVFFGTTEVVPLRAYAFEEIPSFERWWRGSFELTLAKSFFRSRGGSGATFRWRAGRVADTLKTPTLSSSLCVGEGLLDPGEGTSFSGCKRFDFLTRGLHRWAIHGVIF